MSACLAEMGDFPGRLTIGAIAPSGGVYAGEARPHLPAAGLTAAAGPPIMGRPLVGPSLPFFLITIGAGAVQFQPGALYTAAVRSSCDRAHFMFQDERMFTPVSVCGWSPDRLRRGCPLCFGPRR